MSFCLTVINSDELSLSVPDPRRGEVERCAHTKRRGWHTTAKGMPALNGEEKNYIIDLILLYSSSVYVVELAGVEVPCCSSSCVGPDDCFAFCCWAAVFC